MYVKILELSIWAKKRHKNLNKSEIYRMYNNGLARCKHESYICLHEPSLRAFSLKKEIDDNVKNIAKKWLDLLHEFLNDTEYQKEKEDQEKEFLNLEKYFENLSKIKQESKNV